jgi:hypothetical protein
MDKEKLKLIIRNLESLVDCLKSEVYSDIDSYKQQEQQYEEIAPYINDYDEVFYDEEEDDIYESVRVNKKYKITNDDDGDGL